jgi:hypothetical protein
MGTILILLVLLVAFALAALRWGYVSSDGPESQEWKRRERSAWPPTESAPTVVAVPRPASWRVIAGTTKTTHDDCTHSMCA